MSENKELIELGQMDITIDDGKKKKGKIHLINIIGEIEGHENMNSQFKTTKYEHVIPKLVEVENDNEIEGLLVVINTVGGDVECGLAIAEMIASLSKPTVSLVIGGSHSIGIPLAVSTDYSFVVSTGTMVVHPVRTTGMMIAVPQTYEYFKLIQDRIVGFVTSHCDISKKRLEKLMLETEVFTKDMGSILVGKQMVEEKIINQVGGIQEAMKKIKELIENKGQK